LRAEIHTIARGLIISGTRVFLAYCDASTNTFLVYLSQAESN